jgi:hypothetical protein
MVKVRKRLSEKERNSKPLGAKQRNIKSTPALQRFQIVSSLPTLIGGISKDMISLTLTETRDIVDLAIQFHSLKLPNHDLN